MFLPGDLCCLQYLSEKLNFAVSNSQWKDEKVVKVLRIWALSHRPAIHITLSTCMHERTHIYSHQVQGWDTSISTAPPQYTQGSGNIAEWGGEKNGARLSGYWIRQGCCTHQLTLAVVTCIGPAQNQASHHSSMDREGSHMENFWNTHP